MHRNAQLPEIFHPYRCLHWISPSLVHSSPPQLTLIMTAVLPVHSSPPYHTPTQSSLAMQHTLITIPDLWTLFPPSSKSLCPCLPTWSMRSAIARGQKCDVQYFQTMACPRTRRILQWRALRYQTLLQLTQLFPLADTTSQTRINSLPRSPKSRTPCEMYSKILHALSYCLPMTSSLTYGIHLAKSHTSETSCLCSPHIYSVYSKCKKWCVLCTDAYS